MTRCARIRAAPRPPSDAATTRCRQIAGSRDKQRRRGRSGSVWCTRPCARMQRSPFRPSWRHAWITSPIAPLRLTTGRSRIRIRPGSAPASYSRRPKGARLTGGCAPGGPAGGAAAPWRRRLSESSGAAVLPPRGGCPLPPASWREVAPRRARAGRARSGHGRGLMPRPGVDQTANRPGCSAE